MRLLICEERDADDAGHAMRESSRWSLNEEERPEHGGALVQTGSCNLTTDDGSRLRSPRRSAPSPPILTSVCCSESSLMHRKCRLSGPRTGGYQLSSSSSCVLIAFFVCVFLLIVSSSADSNTVVLLDTTRESSLDWTRYPYGPQSRTPGWVEESFTNFEQGINWRSYVVCDVAYNNVNNWLWTPFIERRDANRIYIEIKFSMRDCNLFPGMALSCKETFSLLYYEFDAAHKEPPPWEPESYKLIDRIAADEGRFTSNSEVIINTEVRSIPVTKKGVYFAFRDQGACLSLISIRIYHVVCPSVVSKFGLFPETPTGPELTAIVPAQGQCVPNAVEVEPPRLLCKGDGNWTLPSGGCKCMPGYEPSSQSCKVCPPGTFKPAAGDDVCVPCPAHSRAPYRGSTECRCDHGFYRSAKDVRWMACTQPPSAPQNLTGSVVDQNTVMLTWTGPKFLGGRNDTVYRIECDVCDPATSFVPAREGLNETRVVVTGLSPTTAYRFLVYAENGASGHDASQFSDISFTTDAASSPPRPSPPSSPSSSTNGLASQVITDDGSALRYKEAEAPPPKPRTRAAREYGMIAGVTAACLALLVVVIVMIILYAKRSHDECSKKQPSDCDTLEYTHTGERHPITGATMDHPPLVPTPRFNTQFNSPYSTPIFTHYSASPSYVETHTYEDPNQILPLTLKRSTLKQSIGMSCGVPDRSQCDFAIHDHHLHDRLHDRLHDISRNMTLNSRTNPRRTDL